MKRALLALAACAHSAAGVAAATTTCRDRAAQIPMSDPAEYGDRARLARCGRGHLHAHRRRRSVQDRRAGYPIFVAPRAGLSRICSVAPVAASADRFGFVARAADPASDDPDLRGAAGRHAPDDRSAERRAVRRHELHAVPRRARALAGRRGPDRRARQPARAHPRVRCRVRRRRVARDAGEAAPARGRPARGVRRRVHRGHDRGAPGSRRRTHRAFVARTQTSPPGLVATIDAFARAREPLAPRDRVRARCRLGEGARRGRLRRSGRRCRGTRAARGRWICSPSRPMSRRARASRGSSSIRCRVRASARTCASRRRGRRSPASFDARLVERGHALLLEHCAQCHGKYVRAAASISTESIAELGEVGTDPARAEAVDRRVRRGRERSGAHARLYEGHAP